MSVSLTVTQVEETVTVTVTVPAVGMTATFMPETADLGVTGDAERGEIGGDCGKARLR